MTEQEFTSRTALATLIVEVFEIGGRKIDPLAADFCAEFGVDLHPILDAQPDHSPSAREATCANVVNGLLETAASANDMIAAFARLASDVVDMIGGVYALLAEHSATVGEPAEQFRVRVGDDFELPVSPAFIERLRHDVQRLQSIELGVADDRLLGQLVRYDDGESYGEWPPDGDPTRPLLHHIMILRPVLAHLEQRAIHDSSFSGTGAAGRRALSAAEQVLERLERLLLGAGAYLLETDASLDEPGGNLVQRALLRERGLFGARVNPDFFDNLDEPAFLGMQVATGTPLRLSRPEVVRDDALLDHFGGELSYLGGYLAIVRSGLTLSDNRWMDRWGDPQPLSQIVNAPGPERAIDWLNTLEVSALGALDWIDESLWIPAGTATEAITAREFEELLRLPLWRKRDLLFELWMLCRTIATAVRSGWSASLRGMDGEVWTVPERSPDGPVAALSSGDQVLHVWRERPGNLTPDVSVSTTDLAERDLVVVEAKDAREMKTGLEVVQRRPAEAKTALGIADRYAAEFRPSVTWVCNHSKYRGAARVEADENLGSPWHHIRLADEVSPRRIPAAFEATIADALRPATMTDRVLSTSEAIFVVDTTGSMQGPMRELQTFLADLPPRTCSSYSAILFGDHDDEYVVRPVATYPDPAALASAIAREPATHGADHAEALEDAMHHAAWLATGPHQVFVVATDAPPHTANECPSGLDFGDEVNAVLATGARILVLTDWYQTGAEEWNRFGDLERLGLTQLAALAQRLADR